MTLKVGDLMLRLMEVDPNATVILRVNFHAKGPSGAAESRVAMAAYTEAHFEGDAIEIVGDTYR